MLIGLYNLEPKIENTAMMQVSRYHKDRGDSVEIYSPIFPSRYDKVYAFSIFSFTDKSMVRKGMVCGGSGFDIQSRLPAEMEGSDVDYDVFPKCKTSYIWFSRGCIRRCPFCIVWKKEGYIRPVKPKNLNPRGKSITVMDNNFFANLEWKSAIDWLVDKKLPVDFSSGIDVRLINEEQGESLKKLRLLKQLHIAWDNPREDLTSKIEFLTHFIKRKKIMCYVLIGYWSTPEEDMSRVEKLREMRIDPFVMPYDKSDPYQRAFARWVNFKAIFKSIPWEYYHQNPNRRLTI
jgi:hypothetical protein